MKEIVYSYSKATSLITILLFGFFIITSIPSLIKFVHINDTTSLGFLLAFDCLIGAVLVYFILKRVIPAFNNSVALSLDSEKINIYIYNQTIYCNEVQDILFLGRPGQKVIYLILKNSQKIKIETTWLTGNNSEICETFTACLKNSIATDGDL